jgi:hypothetical protein
VFGFLFLVYLVASCVVVGAEVVAAWPGAGRPAPPAPPMSLRAKALAAARGLVRAPREAEPDASRPERTGDP